MGDAWDWFRSTFYGDDVTIVNVVVSIVLLVLLVFAPALSRCFWRPIRTWAKKTPSLVDDMIVDKIPTPLMILVQGLLLLGVISVARAPPAIYSIVFPVCIFLVLLAALWLCSRIVDILSTAMTASSAALKLPDGQGMDDMSPVINKIFKVFVVGLILIMVMQSIGLEVDSLIAAFGLGSLAIGLAFQNTLGNMFATAVLYTDRPFEIGDHVSFSGVEGTVEEVGLRSTRIRLFDATLAVIPNMKLETDVLMNHFRSKTRRLLFSVNVSSKGNIQAFLSDVRGMIRAFPGITKNNNPHLNAYVVATNGRVATVEFKIFLAVGPLSSSKSCRAVVEAVLGTSTGSGRDATPVPREVKALAKTIAKAEEESEEKRELATAKIAPVEKHADKGLVAVKVEGPERENQSVRASWNYWEAWIVVREKFNVDLLELINKHDLFVPGHLVTNEVLGPLPSVDSVKPI